MSHTPGKDRRQMVKRYTSLYTESPREHPEGEWVKYADYQKLLSEIQNIKSKIPEYLTEEYSRESCFRRQLGWPEEGIDIRIPKE